MNFGIIGFGKIARKFVNSITYTTEGKIVAIGSASLKEDDSYLLEHPDVIVYQDYNALLEDENVDAVYIALPHIMHYPWIIKALEKGIPVLSEKPAVLKVEEVDHIIEVSKRTNTYFLEALKTKFNSGIEQLKKDLIYIGKIKELEANFCFNSVPNKSNSSYMFDPKQGGSLNDVGSYVIGFALSIIPEEIVDVRSHMVIDEGVDLHFNTELVFESGAIAKLEGAADEDKERFARIIGTKGSIDIPMFNRITEYTITLDTGEVIHRSIPIIGDDMTKEIQSFIDDVNNKKIESDIHSLKDTRKILEISDSIRKAAVK
jgi:predicted dehydrogenase